MLTFLRRTLPVATGMEFENNHFKANGNKVARYIFGYFLFDHFYFRHHKMKMSWMVWGVWIEYVPYVQILTKPYHTNKNKEEEEQKIVQKIYVAHLILECKTHDKTFIRLFDVQNVVKCKMFKSTCSAYQILL